MNNAGLFIGGAFTTTTEAQYRAILHTNLDGFFHVTQPAIAAMERQGSGHVVQITTTLAEQAMSAIPSVLASLTKGGLNRATRSLATEYAGRGIRVNAVSPGVVRTPMHAPDTHEALAHLHPLGRIAEVDDVVRAVLYLDDSPFVTGEILHVDDGWIAGHWRRRDEMPIVTIQVSREGTAPGADRTTPEQKAAIYRGATDLLQSVLGKDPDDTFVIFQEIELEDWGRGGLPVPAYWRAGGRNK